MNDGPFITQGRAVGFIYANLSHKEEFHLQGIRANTRRPTAG